MNDSTIHSAALQRCHLPMFSSRISLPYIIHWQACSWKNSLGAANVREHLWKAKGLQHSNIMTNIQTSVTLTLFHFLCQAVAGAQLRKSLDVSLSWPLGANTREVFLFSPYYYWAFYKNNAPCLHVRIQKDNTDKNKQWKLWNFTSVGTFSTC